MRNGPKIEKIGQHTKSTRPGLPHTSVSHDRVPLASLNHSLKQLHTGVSLLSPIEEALRWGCIGGSKKLLKESRSIHLRSWIHHQD
ncbi:hypothetical protein F383_33601 [Gossypium arboreum]|uniref:Uncharacterized protein n=1 Tax=Gossypium arboreum TaxID=29729 RepID=A0A0B0N4X9_GOSAR|nr:hypothetical protein F383_33601 [Gossypium arboreum]